MDLALSAEQRAFVAEADDWLATHGEAPGDFADLDAEVAWGRRWQATLARDRWVGLDWPERFGGRGLGAMQVALFNLVYARRRLPQPVNRVGLSHAGPTLLAHGTEAQQARWLPPMLTADEIWCQLFSEPGAGSDLASLTTRAVPTADGWSLAGQKVWTSYAQHARWGLCLARTDPDAPRHHGISFLVVDMAAPGVTVRPLASITGDAEFNEVFLDDVHVPSDHLVGGLHDGWRVAATTLAHERGVNFPVKEQVVHEQLFGDLVAAALAQGRLDDPLAAERVARAYVQARLLAWANLRTLTGLERGHTPGPESSLVKLTWSRLTQDLSHAAVDLLAPDPRWDRQYLWSRAASIAGGTSEIQRTIIGERLLGLPRG